MNNATTTEGFKVIDSTNGAHLRDATDDEIERFWASQTHPHAKRGELTFTRAARISAEEVVDHWSGYGIRHA